MSEPFYTADETQGAISANVDLLSSFRLKSGASVLDAVMDLASSGYVFDEGDAHALTTMSRYFGEETPFRGSFSMSLPGKLWGAQDTQRFNLTG